MTRLTANQQRVFDVLNQADGPLGAYAILKQTGLRGAVQVYRALQASLCQSNFQVNRAVVEFHGICGSCAGRKSYAEKLK